MNGTLSPPTNSRLLVVGDEPVHRQALINHLSPLGHRLVQAEDGQQALRLIDQEKPDLVLLAAALPGLSGHEVCREIRTRFSRQELPVVFLAANNQAGDLVRVLEAGANDYLVQPIAGEELQARLRAHLEMHSLQRELAALAAAKTAELEAALQDLEAKNAALENFTHSVSHDLKSPLMTIMGFAGLLKRDVETGHLDRLDENVARIEEGAMKMSELLKELSEGEGG